MSTYLKSVINKLTPECRSFLNSAINFAVSRSHIEVDALHFLWVIFSGNKHIIQKISAITGFNPETVLIATEKELCRLNTTPQPLPVFSESIEMLLEKAWLHASTKWLSANIDIPVLLATLVNIRTLVFPNSVSETLCCDTDVVDNILTSFSESSKQTTSTFSVKNYKQSLIENYTVNYSLLAERGRLDPVTGREQEIRQLIDILLRRRQNNPILTGEPGVGKTSIVEGLALKIAAGDVPDALKNVEILALDIVALLAGANVKGEFENRFKKLLTELNASKDSVILFIDEAHALTGVGGIPGQTDAANLLKPALARGELRIIAATTWNEYKKYFEKDGALARRFQVINVSEPENDATAAMLRTLLPTLENHHNVCIREEAITAAVNLSDRYLRGRRQPDKSISLLDTACARVTVSQSVVPDAIQNIQSELVRIQGELTLLTQEETDTSRQHYLRDQIVQLEQTEIQLRSVWFYQRELVTKIQETDDLSLKSMLRKELEDTYKNDGPMVYECVDKACIADVISGWTGIPLGTYLENEQEKTTTLLLRLQQRIFGQSYAMSSIASQLLVCRADLKDPEKTDGVFLLAGSSGTGKTATARALAELAYGGDKNLITINMTEFQEAHSVSTLKGAPPGYIGFGVGGTLTERVSHNPYSVILLDEIEKAHPDVLEFFFQIFDFGIIEDAEGKMVSFRDCLIIMTSNFASNKLERFWDEGERDPENIKKKLLPLFDEHFGPAFMGRVNLIPFIPLNTEILKNIIHLKLDRICHRFELASAQQFKLIYSNYLIEWLIHKCNHKQSGAREIDSVLNSSVLPVLANFLIAPSVKKAHLIKISVRKNKITLQNIK